MKTRDQEKMCLSCDGTISVDVKTCPYCGTDQDIGGVQNSFQAPLFQNQSLEDSLTSLYKPPYQGKRPQFDETTAVQDEIEDAPTPFEAHPPYKSVSAEKPQMDTLLSSSREEEEVPVRSSLWPTLLLIIGSNLMILGLIQLFFSKNGLLTLEWDANHWFFHVLVAVPLLYFGYKKLGTLSD